MFKETQVESKCGFYLELDGVKTKTVYLVFRAEGSKAVYPIQMQSAFIVKNKVQRLAKRVRGIWLPMA